MGDNALALPCSNGLYVTKADTYLTSEKVPEPKNILLTLPFGWLVSVVETADIPEIGRIRGRIVDPPGWITLIDTSTSTTWAEKQEILPGDYSILAGSTSVTSGKRPSRDTIVAELPPGAAVKVVEVEHLLDISRIRGRIVEPAGWITILHSRRGYRWAAPLVETQARENTEYSPAFASGMPALPALPAGGFPNLSRSFSSNPALRAAENVPFIDTDGDSNILVANPRGSLDFYVNDELVLVDVEECTVEGNSLTIKGDPVGNFDFDGTLIAEVPPEQIEALSLAAELAERKKGN